MKYDVITYIFTHVHALIADALLKRSLDSQVGTAVEDLGLFYQ